MATRIQLRRDTAVNWASTNPVLSLGEPGVEIDTHNMKVGDGVTAWNDLAYTAKDAGDGGLVSVFINVGDYYTNSPRISEDGIHWTIQALTGSSGTTHSNYWSVNSVAIGNGLIVYRGYNEKSNRDEIRYGKGPYQSAITPDSDLTRRGPNGEDIHWNSLDFGGGYFIASGYYYDSVRNDYNYPIAAYSGDGATWTRINIDLDYIETLIVAQNDAYNNTAGGMRISSAVRGTNGWLFTLRYEFDNTNDNGSNRIEPGAFYITNITTALNSSSHFSTIPSISWSSWFDGHGWIGYSTNDYIYINTNTDPRQGTWTDINLGTIVTDLEINFSDYYDAQDVSAGELDGVNYMAISDYYGIVYYTADQGDTWNYVTPGPAYAGVYELERNVNGGLRFSSSSSNVNWGQYPEGEYNGEKITITGSYVADLNGTWWMDDYDGTSYPLYSDKAKQNRLDTSGFDSLDIVQKYVNYGEKGDTHIVLPDTTNIVVGQRIYGIDAVRTKEDVDGDWAEPNLVTAVNTDTDTITLKYPLYQDFSGENLYFQAVVKYTHGDQIRNLTYGGGKFIATGNDTNRAYFTTNMTDWKFTQYASSGSGWNDGATAYGALDINTNSLRNDSEFLPGITNSLSIGDAFNVTVSNITDAEMGMYDYYGATDIGTGSIVIEPSSGLWSLGTYDNARDNGVSISSYIGYQNPFGQDGWPNVTGDDYYHATGVRIETRDNDFYFDDYYGVFIAPTIAIGNANGDYYDYYGYNHIDSIFFEGTDIYVPENNDLTIYAYSNNNDGGIYIHWDDTSKIALDSYGVTLTTRNGYDWNFDGDSDGVLYAPFNSDIDIGGHWAIGQRHGTSGYPFIGATDNIVDTDPYDFVIQAGQDNNGSVRNYWYFNRDGNFQLPPSGRIDVDDFWQIGYFEHTYIGATDNVVDTDPYDIRVKVGNFNNNTYFYFNRTGTFQLPVGGDIVNSDGGSVLNQDIPQNAVSADGDYTFVIGDRGKHIYKTGTGNVKIPTNADVAFGIGTCITLVTGSTNSTQIVPVTSGTTTVILSKFGANANINVPADTYVTILKIDTDKWIVQT